MVFFQTELFSIQRYGLDNADLCDQRKALWVSISKMFDEYATCGLKAKKKRCIASAGRAKQLTIELGKFLHPQHEFTALVRDCFNAHQVGQALYRQLATTKMAA